VNDLVDHASHEITGGPYQQSPEDIRDGERRWADVQPILFEVLDYLVSDLAS
jgi:hypothetical protein